MSGGSATGADDLITVTVVRDGQGYGMKVSGDNPVYVQSVKEHGAAWRAGLRAGDRILRVNSHPVHHHTHQQVVQMIRAHPTIMLTVHQSQRHKTPITAPVPVNPEKKRQAELTKANIFRLMMDNEQKHISELRNELSKVPDVRKQAELESAELRFAKLQHEIESLGGLQPEPVRQSTPRSSVKAEKPQNTSTSFLSGIPRSLSNLTGQSLRNLRQNRLKSENVANVVNVANTTPQMAAPVLQRQSSEEKRRHNNTVPLIPTTCLDNTPPPLPPRPAKMGSSQVLNRPSGAIEKAKFRRSSHSLDGELDGPLPNSIAMQMSYPLVTGQPPPLQNDNRGPIMHVRSQSSPEHLHQTSQNRHHSPPPGTPPPPYHSNTQPCADPQRAIISMEEDDSPTSDTSTYSGLFSNLRSVRESKARMAVLLNWLLAERRSANACLVLLITDGYRLSNAIRPATYRRWAYEIQSTFLIPNAVLQLNGVDENMANEIEHVLSNEYEKEELLRNVFRKARQKAKDELAQQLSEFQVKRQVGLGTLYGPDDSVLDKCEVDKAQEQIVVEQLMCACIRSLSANVSDEVGVPLLAAVITAALVLHCRPASVSAASGGTRAQFLLRDKLYKQRVKQLTKGQPNPLVVRGHHLSLVSLTSVAHCHRCDLALTGLAPQGYVCTDCELRVHRGCAKSVEEPCCMDQEQRTRISRLMDRIHTNAAGQDSNDKKSKKNVSSNFLNMERSFRKIEDEPVWDTSVTALERRDESDESLYESADGHSDVISGQSDVISGQSDVISASDDAFPLNKVTPTLSKESLKLAVTDEEADIEKSKKGHRKTKSLINPLEMVATLGEEWLETAKKELAKNCEEIKSKEIVYSDDDQTLKDKQRKNSKKDDKARKNSTESTKSKKVQRPSVSLNFLKRKKTQSTNSKTNSLASERSVILDEIISCTKTFLEEERKYSSLCEIVEVEISDTEEELPPRISDRRRRLSRQASRNKSKVRGKSQAVKVNTLRKSHSGTMKKKKKKSPVTGRSRQPSIAEPTPVMKKKGVAVKANSWLFSTAKGEPRREGSSEEVVSQEAEDATDTKEVDKDTSNAPPTARGVNRAESCRERDAPRRGKHRNASDPNRLTKHHHADLEPTGATAPSGSSSSSSLSSRSNESNTVTAEPQACQSELSEEEEEALSAVWSDSVPKDLLDLLPLTPAQRKRQEVIHELIVSEGSHVRWLKVLGRVFLKSLENVPHLLPPEDLKSLFPNLPAVRERHSRLYAELRAARSQAVNYEVAVKPVADAVLTTLGENNYASVLSRFCRSQRASLESLRDRRRKNKELHQYLHVREQMPVCGRLQLRDLLACVWQRLTKYQLLLETILKTMQDDSRVTPEEATSLRQALDVAKDVLHQVDTSIRTAENEHRLRSIQSKLEVRTTAAGDWEELRRLDLTSRCLLCEGELTVRQDNNKKCPTTALMFSDMLVLLQREGDKYILKPIPSQNQHLSPIIRWDKVLFRENAAARNTFFLMHINGIMMHELSANTHNEYATWVRQIEGVPLAKLTEFRSHHIRSTEDSVPGPAVSRASSDASEKSPLPPLPPRNQPIRDLPVDPPPNQPIRDLPADPPPNQPIRDLPADPTDVPGTPEGDVGDGEANGSEHRSGRHVLGVYSPGELESPTAVSTSAPPHTLTARQVTTHMERLKILDREIISRLSEKAALVGEILGIGSENRTHLEDLAVAESNGLLEPSEMSETPDVHQLLLAAHAQANQLCELISRAMIVTEEDIVRVRGQCDSCSSHKPAAPPLEPPPWLSTVSSLPPLAGGVLSSLTSLLRAHTSHTTGTSALREELAVLRDRADRDMHSRLTSTNRLLELDPDDDFLDPTLEDQPSNGG